MADLVTKIKISPIVKILFLSLLISLSIFALTHFFDAFSKFQRFGYDLTTGFEWFMQIWTCGILFNSFNEFGHC